MLKNVWLRYILHVLAKDNSLKAPTWKRFCSLPKFLLSFSYYLLQWVDISGSYIYIYPYLKFSMKTFFFGSFLKKTKKYCKLLSKLKVWRASYLPGFFTPPAVRSKTEKFPKYLLNLSKGHFCKEQHALFQKFRWFPKHLAEFCFSSLLFFGKMFLLIRWQLLLSENV